MKSLLTLIDIRILFYLNLAVGLVMFYLLVFVKEVDPGQFPWMMNFMIYAGVSYLMVVLVEKKSNPYQLMGGYLGSYLILLGTSGFVLYQLAV